MTTALYKGWTPAQAAAVIAGLPKYAICMSQFDKDSEGNPVDEEATKVNFMDAVDLLELDGIEPPTTATNRDQLLTNAMTDITQGAMVRDARLAYDLIVLKLARLEPSATEWLETYEQLNEARNVLVAYQAKLEQAQAKATVEPTKVEQAPEPVAKAKSVPQQKAEDNARIALANKGKSAKEKAEALDVPVATVKKVEKAKAKAQPEVTTQISQMKADEMRKLAKELQIDYTSVNFRSKSERAAFEATLKEAVLQKKSVKWEGLSASRQAQLEKMATIADKDLRQGAVFLKY